MRNTVPVPVHFDFYGLRLAQINEPCSEDGVYVFGIILEEGQEPIVNLSEDAAIKLLVYLEKALDAKEDMDKVE